jgi:hypothetical protein
MDAVSMPWRLGYRQHALNTMACPMDPLRHAVLSLYLLVYTRSIH